MGCGSQTGMGTRREAACDGERERKCIGAEPSVRCASERVQLRCSVPDAQSGDLLLITKMPLHKKLKPEDTAQLVRVLLKIAEDRVRAMEAEYVLTSFIWLLSHNTRAMAGCIYTSFSAAELTTVHCRVGRSHQSRGLGGLCMNAAETYTKRKRPEGLQRQIDRV